VAVASRSIFRESALAAYRRNTTRDVLPRLTSWPLVICSWLVLAALLAGAALAWTVQIPAYVAASGVVLDQQHTPTALSQAAVAVLLLPQQQAARLRPGQSVSAQLGTSGPAVDGRVAEVEPGLVAPDTARERYGFSGYPGGLEEPAAAVVVAITGSGTAAEYAGSHVAARIRVGSHRLLSFVPGLGRFTGGDS
jgi:hypothetical protein